MKRRAQPWLGTFVEIAIADAASDAQLQPCFNHAFAVIASVHRLMSFHDPASDVSRINRAAIGESIEIDTRTYEVLETAWSVTAASGGLFDVSCAPKLAEWGYLPMPPGDLPSYAAGRSMFLPESGTSIKKSGAAWIDLGGIAKGYAVDLAIGALKQSGIRSACVNAGGDLRVFGDVVYPVAIRDPARPAAIGMHTHIQEQALATSGCYFSRKQIDGREFSALINGTDGQPITGNISASVRAPTCMLADALTKVVLASANPAHPALHQFGATALIL